MNNLKALRDEIVSRREAVRTEARIRFEEAAAKAAESKPNLEVVEESEDNFQEVEMKVVVEGGLLHRKGSRIIHVLEHGTRKVRRPVVQRIFAQVIETVRNRYCEKVQKYLNDVDEKVKIEMKRA